MNLPGLRGHLIRCWNTQTKGLELRRPGPGPWGSPAQPCPTLGLQPSPLQLPGRDHPGAPARRCGSWGWLPWGASPHLGSFTVRSRLRSWEASWGPGAPVLSPGSGFTWAGGNLAGVTCCPLPAGEGREDASEGLKAWPGHRQPCPLEGGQWAGWAPATGQRFSR